MIETVIIRKHIVALAKRYKGDLCAVTYANRTQAETKQKELGDEWAVYRGMGRPFYVVKVASLTPAEKP